MPTSTSCRRERPRQQRRRSSSWSHTYQRKPQATRSYYSEDDDDDNSAYLSASSASEEERSVSSESESESEEHERRRSKRDRHPDRSCRDDHRRDRHHHGSRSSTRHIAEESSRSRHHRAREQSSRREHKKTPRDRISKEEGRGEDLAATIARLEQQLAEARSTNAKLEDKAAKQDKAIKFLFKDNDKLKRKLEESSSRSQGKALRDLCDRNDLLEAENRQLRERYAALASKVNGTAGGAEPASSGRTSGRNGGMGDRVSSGNSRSTAGSSTATPESPGAGTSSPVPPATASAQQQQTPSPVANIPRVASRRRNSLLAGTGGGGFGGEESQPPLQPQPPLAAVPRTASFRRRNSMLGSGVREIPTSMLQAPPPEFGSDQNNRKDFGGLVGGPSGTITYHGQNDEEDPILGKTFSLNVASPASAAGDGNGGIKSKAEMAKKKIGLRRASMFT